MQSEKGKKLAIVGSVFQLGFIFCLLGTVVGMANTITAMISIQDLPTPVSSGETGVFGDNYYSPSH